MYQYAPGEKYAFISYAHKDSEKVVPILSLLYEDGYRIWYDSGLEVGSEWAQDIEKYLKGADSVIAFISRASLDSINCRNEVTYALNMRKPILVVYLEDVTLTHGMGLQLASFHALYRYRARTFEGFYEELIASEHLLRVKGHAHFEEVTIQEIDDDGDVIDSVSYNTRDTAEDNFARAEALLLGSCGLEKDEATAASLFRRGAEQGHAPSQCRLGYCLEYGKGTIRDKKEAILWYRKAMAQKYPDAYARLSNHYYYRMFPFAKRKAKKLAAMACKLGSARGYYLYAFRYLQKNKTEAVRMLSLSVEGGCVEAMSYLGVHYEYGWGVPCDMKKALELYVRGAKAEDAPALVRLGECYEKGKGVAKDLPTAVSYYRRAAELGNWLGQRALSRLNIK